MIRDRAVESPAPRGRRVVTHAPQRLVALERHGLDVQARSLRVQARQIAMGGGTRPPRLDDRRGGFGPIIVERSWLIVDRESSKHPPLRLGVLHDRVPARLHEEQLPGPQAPTADRLGRSERDRTGLGRHADEPVRRDRERRRPKPVPVHERPDPLAVREDDRRRAVPGSEEPGGPSA